MPAGMRPASRRAAAGRRFDIAATDEATAIRLDDNATAVAGVFRATGPRAMSLVIESDESERRLRGRR